VMAFPLVLALMFAMLMVRPAVAIVIAAFIMAIRSENHVDDYSRAWVAAIAFIVSSPKSETVRDLEADAIAKRTVVAAVGAVIVTATIVRGAMAVITETSVIAILIAASIGGARDVRIAIRIVVFGKGCRRQHRRTYQNEQKILPFRDHDAPGLKSFHGKAESVTFMGERDGSGEQCFMLVQVTLTPIGYV
jgi:hypothetical protein